MRFTKTIKLLIIAGCISLYTYNTYTMDYLKKIPFLNTLIWLYLDDDDDENETSSANNAYERERPKKTLDKDIADKKLPLKMEKILRRTQRGFAPRKAILLHGPTKVDKSTYWENFSSEIAKETGKLRVYKAVGADFLNKYIGITPRKMKMKMKNLDKRESRAYIKFAVKKTLGKLIETDLVNENAVLIFIDEVNTLFTGKNGFAASIALEVVLDQYVRNNQNVYFGGTINSTSNIPNPILNKCELIDNNPNEKSRKSLVKHYIKKFAQEWLKTNINIDSEEMKDIIERVAKITEGMNNEDIIDICLHTTYYVAEDPEQKEMTKQENEKEHIDFLNKYLVSSNLLPGITINVMNNFFEKTKLNASNALLLESSLLDSHKMKDMIGKVARITKKINVEDINTTYFVTENPTYVINDQKRYTWSNFQKAIRDKQKEKELSKELEEQKDINRTCKKTIVDNILLQKVIEDNIIDMNTKTTPVNKKKTNYK